MFHGKDFQGENKACNFQNIFFYHLLIFGKELNLKKNLLEFFDIFKIQLLF